ncbi:predicted protein [Naegleria gruberi]|uniref:Predicted protein n=1 Tax=Naegleria gruberi TaxID=5762 RepID=D2V1N2_NAEGR|nr:uncharacterized protein NAEGRDRAFT_62636 [Naegleria gruberi]EFC49191.1 predicted protein [Naegleria gruberi]|eukprot:XP_002681935.1 predicted protein [Naegleria gruberi strain NEG-M]
MSRVQPITENGAVETTTPYTPRKIIESKSKVLNFLTSIKFTLTLIIFLVILSCTIVFDSIWMSVFAGEVSKLSENVRKSEFNLIISNTERSIKKVVLASELAKSQLYSGFDFSNETQSMSHTFRMHKAIKSHLNDLHMLLVGDSNGNMYGIELEETSVMFTIVNQEKDQSYWNCTDPDKNDECIHGDFPERVEPYSDYTFIPQIASNNQGRTLFSPPFIDSHSNQLSIACTSILAIPPSSKTINFVTML